MSIALTNVQLQPLFIIPGSELPGIGTQNMLQESSGNIRYSGVSTVVGSCGVDLECVTFWPPESRILRETFSSVPVFWQSELSQQYQELGEALSELKEIEEEDEWKIDTPVYDVACYVAVELMLDLRPAPHVFTHGSKSVVFNWTGVTKSLFLTISSDSVSALISTPKKIERRMDFALQALLDSPKLLPAIQSAHLGKPLVLINRMASEPSEFIE